MVRNVATPPSASVRTVVPRSAKRKRRAGEAAGEEAGRRVRGGGHLGAKVPAAPDWLNPGRMDSINELDRAAFVERYGPLFEHSPWVAEDAFSDRPFADSEELFEALRSAMYSAPRERQLALIRPHPDLAGKAAIEGTLTSSSRREQSSAGLDRLTPDEYEQFTSTNAAYRERFGFPFVVCVREHTKESILRVADERLRNTPHQQGRVRGAEVCEGGGAQS